MTCEVQVPSSSSAGASASAYIPQPTSPCGEAVCSAHIKYIYSLQRVKPLALTRQTTQCFGFRCDCNCRAQGRREERRVGGFNLVQRREQ